MERVVVVSVSFIFKFCITPLTGRDRARSNCVECSDYRSWAVGDRFPSTDPPRVHAWDHFIFFNV